MGSKGCETHTVGSDGREISWGIQNMGPGSRTLALCKSRLHRILEHPQCVPLGRAAWERSHHCWVLPLLTSICLPEDSSHKLFQVTDLVKYFAILWVFAVLPPQLPMASSQDSPKLYSLKHHFLSFAGWDFGTSSYIVFQFHMTLNGVLLQIVTIRGGNERALLDFVLMCPHRKTCSS